MLVIGDAREIGHEILFSIGDTGPRVEAPQNRKYTKILRKAEAVRTYYFLRSGVTLIMPLSSFYFTSRRRYIISFEQTMNMVKSLF